MSQQDEVRTPIGPYEGGDEGISIAELFYIFRKRFGWFVVGLLVVLGLAIGYLQVATPQYESQVSVLVEAIQRSSSFESLLDVSSSSAKIATEVELITSRRNIAYALSGLDLSLYTNSDGNDYRDSSVLGNVRERIVVSTVKDTNIVRIAVTDPSPAFARDFANALASSYDNLLTSIAKSSKTAQREFIEEQIPLNDLSLAKAGDMLGNFRETSDIIQLTDKSSMLIEQISYYTLRLEPLKLQLGEEMVFIDAYSRLLTEAGIEGVLNFEEIRSNSNVAKKLEELSAWKTELSMYDSLSRPGGVAPNLDSSSRTYVISSAISQVTKDLLNIVGTLTRSYANEANTQAIVGALTTEVEIEVLKQRAEVFVEELSQLPVLERRLSELQRDVQIHEAIGLKLREMLEEVKLTEAAVTGNVMVVDEANLPTRPVRPNKLLIMAVALLLGSAVGLLLTLGIEALDVSIQSEQQIHKVVGRELPILGWVPLMKVSASDTYPTLSVYNDPLSFESERFKLIANMLFNQDGRQVYTITSCAMAEGKSTIIGNISLALAQMGSRVLVIDGDLRLPSMERYFRLKHRDVGLVDYVKGEATLDECLLLPFDSIPTLHFLNPGNAPLVPSAIFSNPRYHRAIEHFKTIYDFIIIDAPPLESASELLSISKSVDGLIITVRAGVTSKGALYDLVNSLRTAHAPLVGFVFNGVMLGGGGGYRYGYGYTRNYGYGYGQGQSKEERKKRRSATRRRSNSWYRKRYKLDLKTRGKSPRSLFDPVLAFGPHAEYASFDQWVVATNNKKPVVKDELVEEKAVHSEAMNLDDLGLLELDSDARGKQ